MRDMTPRRFVKRTTIRQNLPHPSAEKLNYRDAATVPILQNVCNNVRAWRKDAVIQQNGGGGGVVVTGGTRCSRS